MSITDLGAKNQVRRAGLVFGKTTRASGNTRSIPMKNPLPILAALAVIATPVLAATPETSTTTGTGATINSGATMNAGTITDTGATTTTIAPDAATVEQMTANWPEKVREAIRVTMQKYGPPSEIGMLEAMWHNADMSNSRMAPFKHIHIHKMETPHNFPVVHTDFMKQVVNYEIPEDRADELAMFDGSVTFNRTKGELAAMCDKEEHNILALNVAHDVLTGKRTAEDARTFFAQTIAASKTGEMPEIMQKLQFDAAAMNTADADIEAKVVNR